MTLTQSEIDAIYQDASTAEALMQHPAWPLLTKEIQRLRTGALDAMLTGLSEQRYREHIGIISALDSVLKLPGELVDRRNNMG